LAGSPIRAALFLPDLDAGGAQRTLINLFNALPLRGISANLVAGRGSGAARAWVEGGRSIVDLDCARMRSTLWRLRTFIATERPDVLLSTMVDANIVASLAARLGSFRPKIILRETNSHRARSDLSALQRVAIRWAYPRADVVVALSQGVARELISDYRLDPKRVVTIHNPVDVEAWRSRARAARQAGPPWGTFAGGRPVLVAVGRLIRQKGFDLLLRALAACRGEGRRACLAIVGEGAERPALEALARDLGIADRVLMPGFIADPTPWYAHSDLFVLSSRWEGFGHVIVEAMACGLPVIAFDCPHGPADILGGGEGGILVPPDDVGGLASALDRLLSAPQERSRLAAAASASADRFAPPRIVSEYMTLIEHVVGRPQA
jgi:glycosyltransferase involved in cell wall biosynthesis